MCCYSGVVDLIESVDIVLHSGGEHKKELSLEDLSPALIRQLKRLLRSQGEG
jgi:hypothetical protein